MRTRIQARVQGEKAIETAMRMIAVESPTIKIMLVLLG